MDLFDFGGVIGGSFNSGMGLDYGSYLAAQSAPALGSGFTSFPSENYDDPWMATDFSRHLNTPLRVEIHGVGSTGITAPAAPPIYNSTGTASPTSSLTIGATDYLGSVFTGGSVLLNGWAAQATAASNLYTPQIPHQMSVMETQVFKSVTNLPSIVGGVIALGQVSKSYADNDTRGVYTNAANFLGSTIGAEIGIFVAVSLGLPLAGAAGLGALVAGVTGIVGSWGPGALYDLANNNMREEKLDSVMASARTAVERYYCLNPNAPGAREFLQ